MMRLTMITMAEVINIMAQIMKIYLIGMAWRPMKPRYFVKRLRGTRRRMLTMMMIVTGLLVQIGNFQGSLRYIAKGRKM